MSVIVENLLCLAGMALCVGLGANGINAGIKVIFVVFCLGQIPLCEAFFRKMKFKRMLGLESVYLMSNFLLALIFRLAARASEWETYNGAYCAFMFFVIFSALHWIYVIIRLVIKRRKEGPSEKRPEDLRYGLIRDEDVKNEM